MTVEAELADGRILEFPDGTSPEVVSATVKKMLNPPKPSALERFGVNMKDIFKMATSGERGPLIGGPMGTIAGAGIGKVNELLEKGAYATGGAVTDAMVGKVEPETAAKLGYAANVGVQAIPTVLGAAVGEYAKPSMKAGAERLMKSALKPQMKAVETGDAATAIKTLLDEGVNITPAGAAKLKAQIDVLNKDVMRRIANSPEVVDKNRVGQEIYKTLQKFKQQVNPGADVEAIRKSWSEFYNLVGDRIPIQQAQALKTGTYQMLGNRSYGELKGAEIEAQKALARGLRAGIEERIPEIKSLNAKEADLIKTLDLVEHRLGVAGNRDIGGLAWLANDPKAAAAFFAGRSELFKSAIARMMNSASKSAPLTGAAVGTAIGSE